MSEYWKSTPKYWCKHCSAYVKDTPFERKQHETTAKHQGNLKRFLRGIQNDHERAERDKERARHEVERLNRIVGEGSAPAEALSKSHSAVKGPSNTGARSVVDQKRQWAQLAEMGIQVPAKFGAEVAVPGEWTTVTEQVVDEEVKQESLSTGVRKRKLEVQEGQEEVEELDPAIVSRGWGSITKRYPGAQAVDSDLDLLLNRPLVKGEHDVGEQIKREAVPADNQYDEAFEEPAFKSDEQGHKRGPASLTTNNDVANVLEQIKTEEQVSQHSKAALDTVEAKVPLFKKRKMKTR